LATDNLPSEDVLIPKLLAGDEQAFSQVVQAYHGIMVQLARSIVGEAIADEVAQEAWLAVIRSLHKFERRSSLKTWILRIVSNSAKSRLRHESRSVNLDFTDDSAAFMIDPSHFRSDGHWLIPPNIWHADTPEAILAGTELRRCIDDALKSLPPLQRAVVALRDMQGLDMESICKILEVSESNGRVLLHRARSAVREAIDQFQGKIK
jgi:RNA polymerase sigma-70 factor (ECF subfamily)